jgi:hypothetical protein
MGMNDRSTPIHVGRGPALLLEHCALLAGQDEARPPAYHRLEQAVGGGLARFLVVALAGRKPERVELAA